MAQWILPKELQNAPKAGDQDLHYAVKVFEDGDRNTLEADINAYLLALESTTYPVFLIDITCTPFVVDEEDKLYFGQVVFAAFGQVP